jgi:hypothetical protein
MARTEPPGMGSAETGRVSASKIVRTRITGSAENARYRILRFIRVESQWDISPPQHETHYVLFDHTCKYCGAHHGREKA